MAYETISESDLELIDALQINPRASWRDIGNTLGLSTMTAARRWSTLRRAGFAWSNSTPGRSSRGMIIELACPPGMTDQVVRELTAIPDVMTVGHLTGEFNLFALSVAASLTGMTNFQLQVLNKLPALRSRTHLYHGVYGGSGRWRLNVLNKSQASKLSESTSTPPPSAPVSIHITDRRLYLALGGDARRPLTKLADDLDLTPQAVGRQLKRAQRNGVIDFRVDVARPYAGWHLTAFMWVNTVQEHLLTASEKLGKLPETRFCAPTSGTARNISLIVSLHAPEDVHSLIRRIEATDPWMRVVDCQFGLRLEKVNGRLLDEGGRAIGLVPVDPWASEVKAKAAQHRVGE